MYYNGEWGTVCNTGWDYVDASVVCRQLGYGVSGSTQPIHKYYNNDNFEKGSGSIFLSNIECTSKDYNLATCGHLGVGITYDCDHNDDASVGCSVGMLHAHCSI